MKVKRALISVFDKSGLESFARGLTDLGVEIISTGGTARLLKESGIPVTLVEEVTGFPEMLDGRVKTMHPRLMAGVLARRDVPEHMATIAEHDIEPIDMVVVQPLSLRGGRGPTRRRRRGRDREHRHRRPLDDPRRRQEPHRASRSSPSHDDYAAVARRAPRHGRRALRETLRALAAKAFHAHGALRLRDRQLVQRDRERLPAVRDARLRDPGR